LPGAPKPAEPGCGRDWLSHSLPVDELDIDIDLDFLADEHAAGFEGCIQ
jgi:hypothetical protein